MNEKYYKIDNKELEPEIRKDFQTKGGVYRLHHIKNGQNIQR